jgi:hypothetical protein
MKIIKRNIIFLVLLQGIFFFNFAAENEKQFYKINNVNYEYARPHLFDPFKRIVPDYAEYFGLFKENETLLTYSLVAASTALLIYYDQKLIDEAINLGEKLNISSDDKTTPFIYIGDFQIFRGPTDLGSAMYFIGDGWLHGSIMAGFLTYGLTKDDNRALQTASQLAEGLITTGIATQVLKHITGRESPYRSTEDGGSWDLFPDQIEYHKHVPKYDAFPSGHLATAMMTFTVITENYPEYNYWAKPLGWTLLGLLSFQMMNNSVHWAGDYPLAIAIGYGFGKIAVNSGRTAISSTNQSNNTLRFVPVYKNDAFGLGLQYNFF